MRFDLLGAYKKIFTRGNRIPLGLLSISRTCVAFGAIFFLGGLFPFGSINVGGQEMSLLEFWERGYGPLWVGVTLVLHFYGLSFVLFKKFPRNTTLIIWVVILAYSIKENPNAGHVFGVVIVCLVLYWYLFLHKKNRAYFNRKEDLDYFGR